MLSGQPKSQAIVTTSRADDQQLVQYVPLISQFQPKPEPVWERDPSKDWDQFSRLLEDAQLSVYFGIIDMIPNQDLIDRIPELKQYEAYPSELKLMLHKMKQLIKIHVFQLYDMREKAIKQLSDQVNNHAGNLLKIFFQEIALSVFQGSEDNLEKSLNDFCNKMTQFVHLLKNIYLPEDIGDLDEMLSKLQNSKREIELNKKLKTSGFLSNADQEELNQLQEESLQGLAEVMNTGFLVRTFMKKFEFLLKQKQRFNYSHVVEHLKKVGEVTDESFIAQCKNLEISAPEKFAQFRREYLDAYQHYIKTVEDTTKHIQKFIPLVQESSFDAIISAVNGYIADTISPQAFVSGIIMDLLHQRVSTPEAARSIEDKLISIFIPIYNSYCLDHPTDRETVLVETFVDSIQIERPVKEGAMTLNDFLTLFRETGPQPVLRRRYQHAWEQATEAMELTAGEGNQRMFALQDAKTAPMPVPASSTAPKTRPKIVVLDDDDEEADLEIISSSSATAAAACASSSSHSTALAMMGELRLEPEANAAEQEHFAQAIEKQDKCTGFQNQFAQFSKEETYEKGDADHAAATQLFTQLVKECQSVTELQALLEAAKPYISRHRNQLWDALTSKTDTSTWAKSMTQARQQALILLKEEIKTGTYQNPGTRATHLKYQRRLDIFGYKPKGQRGATKEGEAIDRLIADAEAESQGKKEKKFSGYSWYS